MQVRWTEPALEDMEGIQDYISKDSDFYARQFIERIFEVAKNLEDFPGLGRKVPETKEREDVRELIFQGYRIIYLHQADHVYIVTVIHGSRDLSGMENKPWDGG
jgi:plasmid stabilization system protein ParE